MFLPQTVNFFTLINHSGGERSPGQKNRSLAVHTSLETSVRCVSETVDEKNMALGSFGILEKYGIFGVLWQFFGVFGCHFHSAVLFPRVFGTAYDIYPSQTSA